MGIPISTKLVTTRMAMVPNVPLLQNRNFEMELQLWYDDSARFLKIMSVL